MSACSVTLGIGNGEGFGYPVFESLACGVPCVHGSYSGAAEHMHREMLVDPIAYYSAGAFTSKRAVYRPEDWADAATSCALKASQTARHSLLPRQLDWDNNWANWEKWFREGL